MSGKVARRDASGGLNGMDGLYTDERAILGEREEDELSECDLNATDVLVGIVRSEEQYAHCVSKKYYYIPAKQFPGKLPDIRYVALYRSPRFPEPGIYLFGEVDRIVRVTRSRIPFPSSHSSPDELYYAFVVKGWQRLHSPVRIMDTSIHVAVFTSLFLLTHARYTYELLCIRTKQEYRINKALSELCAAALGRDENEGKAPWRLNPDYSIAPADKMTMENTTQDLLVASNTGFTGARCDDKPSGTDITYILPGGLKIGERLGRIFVSTPSADTLMNESVRSFDAHPRSVLSRVSEIVCRTKNDGI